MRELNKNGLTSKSFSVPSKKSAIVNVDVNDGANIFNFFSKNKNIQKLKNFAKIFKR